MPPQRLVRYFLDGWRFGYVVKTHGDKTRIQPIAPYKGALPHCAWVLSRDVIDDCIQVESYVSDQIVVEKKIERLKLITPILRVKLTR